MSTIWELICALDIWNCSKGQLDLNILIIRLLISTERGDEVVVFKNSTGRELTVLYAVDIGSWFPGSVGLMKMESRLQSFRT